MDWNPGKDMVWRDCEIISTEMTLVEVKGVGEVGQEMVSNKKCPGKHLRNINI